MSSENVILSQSKNSSTKPAFYWQHFDLKQDPFSTHYDDAMTSVLPKWEQHLDLLQHLLHHENALLAVVGLHGVGKTTFMHLLNSQTKDTMSIFTIDNYSGITPNKLIQLIAHGFNVTLRSTDSFEEQAEELISVMQYHTKNCILMLDNAENLSKEILQVLLHLIRQQSVAQMRFHVILFGRSELQSQLAVIAKQELSGDLIHTIELDPLTLEETKQYLHARLTLAGLNELMPFTDLAVAQIHQLSRGVPADINRIAQKALLDEANKYHTFSSFSFTFFKFHQNKILGGILMVIIIGLVTLFFSYQENQTSSTKTVITFANQPPIIAAPPPTELANVSGTVHPLPSSTGEQESKVSMAATSETVHSLPGAADEQQSKVVTPSVPAELANTQEEIQPRASTKDGSETKQTIAAQSLHEFDMEPQARPVIENKPILSQVPKVVPKHTAVSPKKLNEKASLSQIEQGLLKVKKSSYALQLLAVSSEARLREFIKINHLGPKFVYFKQILQGKSRYVLIYGEYATIQAAAVAKKSLPAIFRHYNPWPRTYASIQKELGHS